MVLGSSVCRRGDSGLRRNRTVTFRTTITEELPHLTYFGDHVQIKIRDHHFILIPAGLRNVFPPRIAGVTLVVKFSKVPRFFNAYPIDSAYKVAVGHGMRRLLQLP